MKYQFGKGYFDSITIEAQSLDHAIKLFKVKELFPEKYVDEQYRAKDSEGCPENEKMKAVYILETFLGIKEQIIQICEGQNADEEEPLTLFQQRFYMDEEVGIWDTEIGLDYTRIEEFDQ